MKTEADIASYLGTEGCIVYAHSFSTISSVIPSFCKRGDIIVADRGVNYSIRRGLEISRSSVKWYNHGDMEDLEQVLRKVVKEQAGKKLTRRFIVTEALFETTGDINNLPKLVCIQFFDLTRDHAVLTTRRSNSRPSTSSASCSTRLGPSACSAAPAGA